MGISAIALLRLRTLTPHASENLPAKLLDDGLLLDTRTSFASEPAELSRVVRKQLGDALLAEHVDSRGIFFLPDVASPSARTYEGVIEQVGEGGVWGPLRSDEPPLAAMGGAAGLGALLGGLLEQMPPSLLESVGDAARGRPGALEAASAQLQSALSGSSELSGLVAQLAGAFDPRALGAATGSEPATPGIASKGAAALDLSELSSALSGSGMNMESMQQLASRMQAALEADPNAAASMVERLFGEHGPDSDDWDEDEPTLPATEKPR